MLAPQMEVGSIRGVQCLAYQLPSKHFLGRMTSFFVVISTLWCTGDLSKISGKDIVTKLFSVRYN